MNKEISDYIITYFLHLLTLKEKVALRHYHSLIKLDNSDNIETPEQNNQRRRLYKKMGWLSSDKEVMELLKNGYDAFESNIAERLLSTHSDEIYLNYCPECNKLARTPRAKQCRYCGYSWREKTVASFEIKDTYFLQGRESFFLSGTILNGQINAGNCVDLTMIGLNCRPRILSIEFALKRQENREDTVLEIKLNNRQIEIVGKSKMGIIDILKD